MSESQSFLKLPTTKRIFDTFGGTLLSCISIYHLIVDHQDSPFEIHDTGVIALSIVGVVIVLFPDRVVRIIKAWRGTTPNAR